MQHPTLFENDLNVILEEYLSHEEKARIDRAIAGLQEIRDADFGVMPGGVNAGNHYSDRIEDMVASARRYARTAGDIEQEGVRAKEQEEANDRALTTLNEKVALCQRVEARFGRLFRCLKNGFQFVQPNGELLDYQYNMANPEVLAGLIKFFRTPGLYDNLVNDVKELRDFGFNISSKLLNTDGGKFRTRYSYITGVTFRFEGPYFGIARNKIDTGEPYMPKVFTSTGDGAAIVKVVQMDNSNNNTTRTFELENVTLAHIGEVIDTIDILVRATLDIAQLRDIQLMGTELVQYELKVEHKADKYINFNISSEEITDVNSVIRLVYGKTQEIYGFSQEEEDPMKLRQIADPMGESAPPKEAPPRRKTDQPQREKPTRREPWNPPRPKKMPKPKALKETFERSVHPSTNQFWSGIRQSEHPYSKHPLMAMYGRDKAEKSWKKGVETLKRVFPQLQDMENPQAMQQVPQLAMQAMRSVMEAERPYQQELIQIAKNIVTKVWGVPIGMMVAEFQGQPGMDEQEHVEADPDEVERLRHHINKRITMGALTQGAAVHNMAAIHHMANKELERLAPELLDLYDQFASSSSSMYWMMDFASMAGLAGMAIGQVEVDEDIIIHAKAMVFPVLVQELVKGVMEVLSMHGTDEDLSEDELGTIQSQAERMEDEPWLIQVGPHLWEAFLQIIPKNHPIADVVANFAAKDPEFIHTLLADTIEAVHNTNDPADQRAILSDMMDALDSHDDLGHDDDFGGSEPDSDPDWDVGEPW